MDDGWTYDPRAPHNRAALVSIRRITPDGDVLYLTPAGWGPYLAARRIPRHEAERMQGELVPVVGHVELED
jgi:hypothetical protein